MTKHALELLRSLFGTKDGAGNEMVVRATEGLENPDTMRASCRVLATELLAALGDTANSGPETRS